ncbi:MAG TPA: glycosyltransferase family 4 protein [Opitutaceae bacterium]|nr:glycosyltransferase family 4 protein [Opitutaceae bacterium]
MRILFLSLIPSYWGGSEELWSRCAIALKRAGHEVTAYLSMFREAPRLDELAAAGIRLRYGTPAPMRWWRRWTTHPRGHWFEFERCLSETKPDLAVFSQCAVRDGIDEILACRERGVPYAIINQLTEPLFYPDEKWRCIDRAFSHARRIWFVSRENRDATVRFLAHPLEQAETVPNAYNCRHDGELPWPDSSTPLRLAIVGRIEPEQKGHDLLIETLAREEWRNRPAEVAIIGRGPAEEMLVARCRALGATQIKFVGAIDDPVEIWRTRHALLMPSRYEGQSLAMLEAMLLGRPVIVNPVGGVAGLVADGRNGFVAERADQTAFAAALERAWERRDDWPTLGRTAAADARHHVSPDPGAALAERITAVASAGPRPTPSS